MRNEKEIEKRLADLLCFAMKYESDKDAEIIKRISARYLSALRRADLKVVCVTESTELTKEG